MASDCTVAIDNGYINIRVGAMLMCGKVTHKNLIDSLHYSEKLTKKKQN